MFDGVPITYCFSTRAGLPPEKGLSPSQVRCFYEIGNCDTATMNKFAPILRKELGRPDPPKPYLGNGSATNILTCESAENGSRPQTGAEIILDYFREAYRPVFRRGASIVTFEGEEIGINVSCTLPPSSLITRLESAANAPRFRGGALNYNGLPGFFKTWAKTAWADLLAYLPDEDTAELGADEPTAEVFRRMVRDAMLIEVVLGEVIGKNSEVTQKQRCSLIDWCQKFAKSGPWKPIRSKKCWCKFVPDGADGEIKLKVAIHQGLFAQLRADRRLINMTENTFARRSAKYGVGTSTRNDRPQGMSAVVLNDEFIADLIATLVGDSEVDDPDR